jgi:hypothetical protein
MYVIPVRIIRFGVNHHNIAMSLSYDDLNSDFDVNPALHVLFVKNGFLSKSDSGDLEMRRAVTKLDQKIVVPELCEDNSAPQFKSRAVREIDPQESKC